ncbi:hypothetical protein F2Q68_00044030 [Brassica cretica]|uniref:Uncharacterized protein n=2 Tax=Brassica cretica TaxID=69181 RepID=A0A8S9LEI9_BRACR|nr:hypothetical protein F2Q68_00044030 [Brassica cretica]KAF3517801.1 hypothetical protein DY000_02060065 [Brassica cretica]
MINELGSEVKRLAKELAESRERSSQLEGKWKVIEYAHSLEAKEAKTAKSSELRRLKRKVKSGEGSTVCAIKEAKTREVGEAPPSPRAEESTLSACRAELVDAERDFDLILAGSKSECNLRKLAGFLKMPEYQPRDKFWDLVSGCLILCLEMLETSVLGLGQDLGLITALGGAMTTSTYVSRIVFDQISSRFKVRDMVSAYLTCMVGIEHPFGDNF